MITIVSGVVLVSLNDAWKDQLTSQTIQQLQGDTRQAVNEIIRNGRGAFSVAEIVEDPDNPGSTLASSAQVLVLALNALNAQNQIIAGTDYIVFRRPVVNQTKLERLTVAAANSIRGSGKITLTNNVADLRLRYFDINAQEVIPGIGNLANAREVEITLKLEKNVWGRQLARSFAGRILLRNNAAGQSGANPNQ